ncbi:hypothetical protein [Dyadobacter sp. LHD-138]|uniref:hypothetical protein n=1 Tax=Dyadobacter sp. LHD-138 TaxID=3071413 RepID=UPI0027E19E6D|nr:hypothetical protein [Dyadobacter sp. LHD-138]MDQ6481844.1 hypothetical protein [Dyadobacter sp. LHD-138]
MKRNLVLSGLVALFTGSSELIAQDILPAELQIKMALQAAPADKKDSAMVYGYSSAGQFVILRKGLNDMVCLADNPKQKGVYINCYFKELEPFMARGRELNAERKTYKQKMDTRELDVKNGKVLMPKQPTTLFAYWGSDEALNTETGELKDAQRRYVVYIPFATSKTTGLPNKPDVPGMPWIMDEGTHKAHIMINPANMLHKH